MDEINSKEERKGERERETEKGWGRHSSEKVRTMTTNQDIQGYWGTTNNQFWVNIKIE